MERAIGKPVEADRYRADISKLAELLASRPRLPGVKMSTPGRVAGRWPVRVDRWLDGTRQRYSDIDETHAAAERLAEERG
jgi:hypothetical protein